MSHDARPRYSSPVTPLNGLEPITDDVDMAESPEVQTTTLPIVQSVGPSKVSQQVSQDYRVCWTSQASHHLTPIGYHLCL